MMKKRDGKKGEEFSQKPLTETKNLCFTFFAFPPKLVNRKKRELRNFIVRSRASSNYVVTSNLTLWVCHRLVCDD